MKNDLFGMRYSKQRELILQQVQELQDHPTAEEIYKTALHLCPSLSLGTVYRNLNSLVEMGKVRRVCIPGQPDRFDHTLPWHGHLYCTRCGRVEDLPLDGEVLRRAVTVPQGRISDCVVTWIGLCQACAGELDLPEEPAGSEAAVF